MKEARAAGTSSSAGAMASAKELAEEAGLGFPRLLSPPSPRPGPAFVGCWPQGGDRERRVIARSLEP